MERIKTILGLLIVLLAGSNCLAQTSGTTGSCSWAFSDSILTVSGNGPMENYNSMGAVHWNAIRSSIREVRISEGVTSIGNFAFANCHNLKEKLIIPGSVASIGVMAFQNCVRLEEVSFSEGLASIGLMAFTACGLKEIELPASVTSIGEKAFWFCTKLTLITVHRDTPAICDDTAFGEIDKESCMLQIPKGSIVRYKEATGWKDFIYISDGINIEGTTANARIVRLYPQGNNIVAEGVEQNETIAIYDQRGILIQKVNATGERIEIPLLPNRIYIVKTSSGSLKIAL